MEAADIDLRELRIHLRFTFLPSYIAISALEEPFVEVAGLLSVCEILQKINLLASETNQALTEKQEGKDFIL